MANGIAQHFTQPAGIPAVTLCSGVLTAWCAAYVGIPEEDSRALLLMFGFFTALPSGAYLSWRVMRPFSKREGGNPGACAICHERGATSPVRYLQLTGAVVLMVMRELPVFACRRCSRDAFLRMTIHSMLLGWWGVFAVFLNPGFVINNILFLIRSHITGGSGDYARRLLDDRRDYARNLLATKDKQTVVDVLARDTGLHSDIVAKYLDNLAQERTSLRAPRALEGKGWCSR